ncbi:peroxisome biogenesis factor 10-like [Halichondria panicea]|uniref:peroxisome biogenesis factor 10-like n=1 Tax=Halichondria panicea TaxID=6063 RepID=UPI00312B4CFF
MSMSQLHLLPAGAPELVRSNQKDRFYIDRISALLSEISRQLLPLRSWIKWQRELHLLTELGYYGLTTLLDNQTLGEEYTNTIQVKSHIEGTSTQPLYTPAGLVSRTLAILLQTVGPYIIERALEEIYKRLNERSLDSLNVTEQQYQVLEKTVEFLEELVSTFNKLHLSLFYLRGIFYHFGKRFTGINYVMVRYKTTTLADVTASRNTYCILSWIIFAQIAFRVLKWIWDYFKSRTKKTTHSTVNRIQEESQRDDIMVSTSLKCPLCLEMCEAPTTTLCGHVFCWDCVCEWVSENIACPVCRCSVEPQQLVCLQHFES